jgi:hypothetical protein
VYKKEGTLKKEDKPETNETGCLRCVNEKDEERLKIFLICIM